MSDSIVKHIRFCMGYSEEDSSFDNTLIPHINTALCVLKDLGIAIDSPLVEDDTLTYQTYLNNPENCSPIFMLKTYVQTRVKILFDPPASVTIVECLNRTANELGWRLKNMMIEEDVDDTE